MGREKIKWMASCKTKATTTALLGKFTFLIIDAFIRNIIGETLIELEIHCQGKRPDNKKRT
jgi:hypothetical protein